MIWIDTLERTKRINEGTSIRNCRSGLHRHSETEAEGRLDIAGIRKRGRPLGVPWQASRSVASEETSALLVMVPLDTISNGSTDTATDQQRSQNR